MSRDGHCDRLRQIPDEHRSAGPEGSASRQAGSGSGHSGNSAAGSQQACERTEQNCDPQRSRPARYSLVSTVVFPREERRQRSGSERHGDPDVYSETDGLTVRSARVITYSIVGLFSLFAVRMTPPIAPSPGPLLNSTIAGEPVATASYAAPDLVVAPVVVVASNKEKVDTLTLSGTIQSSLY